MDSQIESNEIKILLGENLSITEHFHFHKPNHTLWPNRSIQEQIFHVILLSILETVGNFLLFCMIIYEKYGMDSQKRTVTNQLLSSICTSNIFNNIVFMPIFMAQRTFGPLSKNHSIFTHGHREGGPTARLKNFKTPFFKRY